MKGRRISVGLSDTPQTVMHRVIAIRFAEVLERAAELASGSVSGLHDLRIACKRLRYALETFSTELPRLSNAVETLREMQDTLGELHDCDILAEAAIRCSTRRLYNRLLRDRARLLLIAREKWTVAFRKGGGFTPLISYAHLHA